MQLLVGLLQCAAAAQLLTIFMDEAEFQLACKALDTVQVNMGEKTLRMAREGGGRPLPDQARLGATLTLLGQDTHHPMDIQFTSLGLGGAAPDLLARRIADDHGTHATALGVPAALSLRVSTVMHSFSRDYSLVYALGFSIYGSTQLAGKTISAYSPWVRC